MSFRYHLALDCETCGQQMRVSVLDLDADPPDKDLVIDLGLTASQVEFVCGNCGGRTYTGDLDVAYLPGEEVDHDDDE